MDTIKTKRKSALVALICLLLAIFSGKDVSASESDDFVITVQTDNPGTSSTTQFTIPTVSLETYNYNVDCDNAGTNEAEGLTGSYTCNYSSAGTYTIRIMDNVGDGTGFPRIYFNNSGDRLKLLTIDQWGTGKWTSMISAFQGCENLTSTGSDAPNLSVAQYLDEMFESASSFNADMSNWDTSNIVDMSFMFSNATSFNGDIGGWNTSNVIYLTGMFAGASSFNQDISGWDTSKVEYMSFIFGAASAFNQNIGEWNTSSATYMSNMFAGAGSFNQDISGWDTSKVINMAYMFYEATAFDQNIGGWDVTSLTSAEYMFSGTALSTTNYDALLNGWNAQTLNSGVTFDGGNSTYCAGEVARSNMIASDGWDITDGGKDCPSVGVLFWDDFETGDFSLWTRFNDGKGFLYPCTDAAINGNWGACVERGTNDKRKQLIDETPVNQTTFNASLNINFSNLSMGEGERFRFMQVKMGAERPFFIVLMCRDGQYWIQLNTLSDDLTKTKTRWYILTDAAHNIEVDWQAASVAGANDGDAHLIIDDTVMESLTGLDNDTLFIESFKVGFTSRLDGKVISGIFYIDDVATSNIEHIGLP